jgi:hypothetical protein
MYPGTYQPLQAVALLLADLLQHPWSDDASLSRGLVDAIFDLYQVEEGIVSRNDPPRRRLSTSGKDAWSMLVRTRKKALEQIGQDHHALFPQRLASSDLCLCGERIAGQNPRRRSRNEQRQRQSPLGQETEKPATLMNTYGFTDEEQESIPDQDDLIGSVDFDWLEWDAFVGGSMGLMS